MKILIGIDDSKVSGDVSRAIVTQFRAEHTEIRVLHVLQPLAPAPPQMAPGYAPELDDQKKPARELVERIAKELLSGPPLCRKRKMKVTGWSAQMYSAFVGAQSSWP